MGRRIRAVALAATGLIAVAVPVMAWGAPASATSADQTNYITFVSLAGSANTCGVDAYATLDSDAHTLGVVAQPRFVSGTYSACMAGVLLEYTLTYKDERGVSHTTSGYSYEYFELRVDHVGSNVRFTGKATFGACSSQASATCSVSATAAPK